MGKTDKDEKNIHEGHRERLLDLAINAGIDNLSDFQVLELFLTYVFPRGDVNPLAHRLLKEYETFSQVIDSEPVDLIRIDGINDRSAKKITFLKEFFYFYTTSRMGKKYMISTEGDLIDLVEDHLRFRTAENMIIFALSAANIITHKRRIKTNSGTQVGISMLELTGFLSMAKPAAIVVAHCHPNGKAEPSEDDSDAFNMMKRLCETCGINFIDSYIVGENGVYSQRSQELLRTYYDVASLKKSFKTLSGRDDD